jgi:hypothetical protein
MFFSTSFIDMKHLITTLVFCLFVLQTAFAQKTDPDFITSDIDNFWKAYDKIVTTKDSAQQYAYLNQLFIEKGTPGLKAIMQARQYTPKSYIDAINQYPLFWNSIRANTLKARVFSNEIAANVLKLKKLYPDLKPAQIYFTIGAFRTGGTTRGNMILIGSEIALTDKNTVKQEFSKNQSSSKTSAKTYPIDLVVFTNVHEYVHTQQKTNEGDYLLAQCVMEGVAEFVAVKATGQATTLPALYYAKDHYERIREVFSQQLFNPAYSFWLYSDAQNEFGVRDLGYYVGYVMCEKYYNKATDKKQAIKDMIELNYNNELALSRVVDESGYLTKPVQTLKSEYEEHRPTVTGIKEFKNNTTNVDTTNTQITLLFSEDMNKRYSNFEFGPLGKSNLLKIKEFKGFSEDGRSITFMVELKPGQHYQIVIGAGFRNKDGIPLKPYLIDFSTMGK